MENEMKTHHCKFICRRVTVGAHIVHPQHRQMDVPVCGSTLCSPMICFVQMIRKHNRYVNFQFSIWQRKPA